MNQRKCCWRCKERENSNGRAIAVIFIKKEVFEFRDRLKLESNQWEQNSEPARTLIFIHKIKLMHYDDVIIVYEFSILLKRTWATVWCTSFMLMLLIYRILCVQIWIFKLWEFQISAENFKFQNFLRVSEVT
jgi:hypothetical protein